LPEFKMANLTPPVYLYLLSYYSVDSYIVMLIRGDSSFYHLALLGRCTGVCNNSWLHEFWKLSF